MPPNGIAVYACDTAKWAFEPPEPIPSNVYRCDKEFVLEPLEQMLESKQVFGLVVIDRKEASIGLLKGKAIVPLKNLQSLVPQKVNRGGQSQARIQRQADNAVLEWFSKVGETASQLFLPRLDKLQGILVGGPGHTRKEWLAGSTLDFRVWQKVQSETFDTCYTDEYQGLKELVARAEQYIEGLEITKEKQVLRRFYDGIRTGASVYGEKQVLAALAEGRVDTLLLSADYSKPEGFNGKLVRISEESEDGAAFKKGFGGIGGFLRY